MQKWEYKTIFKGADDLENQLNRLGDEGWEVAAATDYHVILKRPKN